MYEPIDILPKIQVLSPEAIARIHSSSLKILSEIGIRVDSDYARKIFQSADGVELIDDQRITFEPELIEWAIHQAPVFIDIFNRKGEIAFRLGEASTRFGIGVTNLFYQEPDNETIVPFTRAHMRGSVALGNSLPAYDLVSTIGIIRDVDIAKADLIAVLEILSATTKPLVILISDDRQFKPCMQLIQHLFGDISTKPFIMPYFNPVTPLILNQTTADNMLTSIQYGLPIIFSNYGMAGVSTPISSAGTLALLNAELLAGLVFSQLAMPGTPMILGSLPAFFDMKYLVDFFDPQTMLLNLACAEMMSFYNIPHAGTSGSTNGWGADLIASQTMIINHLTSCLGKAGLAPFVGGAFGSKVFSPSLVVYSNEVIEQSRQFAQGFRLEEEFISLEEIRKIGVGGNFTASRQTSKLFRNAYLNSAIFPRLSMEKWQESGCPDAAKFLRERTLELINHPKYPDDQEELLGKGESFIFRSRKLY